MPAPQAPGKVMPAPYAPGAPQAPTTAPAPSAPPDGTLQSHRQAILELQQTLQNTIAPGQNFTIPQ